MNSQPTVSNCGSRWCRWEPHIHTPGTVLNDHFKGVDSWERYLGALETTTPAIRALGVTDYYSTDTYERVVEAKRNGRLPACDLIFPNIEMRLGVGTDRRAHAGFLAGSRLSQNLSKGPPALSVC